MKKEIMMTIGNISHMHRYAADDLLSRRGISVGQPPIMRYLSEHDGCIQKDLAEHCRVSPASVSSALDKMEQDGYIERHGTKDDKRVQHVFLTEAGRAKNLVIRQVFRQLEEVCLEEVSEEEMAVLVVILRKMRRNIEKFYESKGDFTL